jgi:hypothetical protein
LGAHAVYCFQARQFPACANALIEGDGAPTGEIAQRTEIPNLCRFQTTCGSDRETEWWFKAKRTHISMGLNRWFLNSCHLTKKIYWGF